MSGCSGFTNKINWPRNQKFYQVETLVFGNAIVRALNPERIIVGSGEKKYVKNLIFLESLDAQFYA